MKKMIILFGLLSLNACVLSNPDNTEDSVYVQFVKALENPSCYNCRYYTEEDINNAVADKKQAVTNK